jgi:long-chain acyl-CoA synthetase
VGMEHDPISLHKHCERHLSKHKRPRVYEACDGDLPRNFLGKVLRRKLRESFDATSNHYEENQA